MVRYAVCDHRAVFTCSTRLCTAARHVAYVPRRRVLLGLLASNNGGGVAQEKTKQEFAEVTLLRFTPIACSTRRWTLQGAPPRRRASCCRASWHPAAAAAARTATARTACWRRCCGRGRTPRRAVSRSPAAALRRSPAPAFISSTSAPSDSQSLGSTVAVTAETSASKGRLQQNKQCYDQQHV